MSVKLIFHDEVEESSEEGAITSQSLANGLVHLHDKEPTSSELMAQLIYEDFVKNR